MREVLSTDKAPKAIGPYSQAVRAGSLLFTSGQIPIDPATGALVDGDIAAQTRQVMVNLSEVLKAAGVSWREVVKTTVYLANMEEFAAMNAVYAEFVASPPPARVTVQVARLPRDARIEIDLVADLQ